ncbi:MAG: prolipoprotein diacylglyceryl transferase [Oscillospiraceae bacterium]|nr:prolipoprotein diacylglyceryl transferase [Oscillospiraceae bacterium]
MSNATITFPLFGDGFSLDFSRYFTLFGFNVYYYAIFIVLGYALAAFYLMRRSELFGLTRDNIYDLVLIAVPCGLIGARLYFMIFNFDLYFGPGQWGNILRFRDGGLAIYGGIIASGLVFIIYSRIKKISLGNLLDAAGFGLLIGQSVGRWGNFINREAFGSETDLPWRMGLTAGATTIYVHPTFLYESLWNIVGLILMHIFSKKSKTKYPGQYFLFYVAWYGFGRFLIEGLRADSLMIPGTDFRASQWLAALSFLVAAGILIRNHLRSKNDIAESTVEPKVDEDEESTIDGDEIVGDEIEQLAVLDGADAGEIDSESDDEVDEDEESTENLAALDGASEDDVSKES